MYELYSSYSNHDGATWYYGYTNEGGTLGAATMYEAYKNLLMYKEALSTSGFPPGYFRSFFNPNDDNTSYKYHLILSAPTLEEFQQLPEKYPEHFV